VVNWVDCVSGWEADLTKFNFLPCVNNIEYTVYLGMRKPYLFGILFLITFLVSGYCFITPQLLDIKTNLVSWHIDSKYILHIDQSTVTRPKDTSIYGEKTRLTWFVLKLTNNTNDTLKYISMSCSWWDIYRISNNNIGSFSSVCEKNIPVVINLPPHQTSKINFPLKITKAKDVRGQKFRIGMNVVVYKSWSQVWNSSVWDKLSSGNNLIWSNEVMIP
jgi:hypothetical protein